MTLSATIGVLAIFISVVYIYFKNIFSYWSSKNVPGPKPVWIFGYYYDQYIKRIPGFIVDQKLYYKYQDLGFCGLYMWTRPVFCICDPKLLHSIFIKDFDHFTDKCFMSLNNEIVGQILLATKGEKWKRTRSKISPSFTSSKIKSMFEAINENCSDVVQFLDLNIGEKNINEFNMIKLFGNFAMDVIANVAFAVKTNSIFHEKHPFTENVEYFFERSSVKKSFLIFLQQFTPKLSKFFGIDTFRKPVEFFRKVVKETMEYRSKNNVQRHDFLQLLLEQKEKDDEEIFTESAITAQGIMLYFAGMDSVSRLLTFVAYNLATHPEVQEKLIREIDEFVEDKDAEISYESLQKLTYLDMIIKETLRMYPPQTAVTRLCTKDYDIPENSVTIKKGTRILIPIYSFHYDPKYWKNPETFDPERFSNNEKNQRNPMVFIPFGAGPRICLGERFAMIESKLLMAKMLKNFKFVRNGKTRLEYKVNADKSLHPKGGLSLNIEKRE